MTNLARVLAGLRGIAGRATPGRSTKLLALTGGMANEALFEIGDPTAGGAGGRSLQMPKTDAVFHAAFNPATALALLRVVEAADAIVQNSDLHWADPIERRYAREQELIKALEALSRLEVGE